MGVKCQKLWLLGKALSKAISVPPSFGLPYSVLPRLLSLPVNRHIAERISRDEDDGLVPYDIFDQVNSQR
jgi:hypothetical protein